MPGWLIAVLTTVILAGLLVVTWWFSIRRRSKHRKLLSYKDASDLLLAPAPPSEDFVLKYRALLDAEDQAFDELEHATEEGDRTQFDKEMADWQFALERKLAFLANAGIEVKADGATDPFELAVDAALRAMTRTGTVVFNPP